MVALNTTHPIPVAFTVRQGDRQYQLSYRRVFAIGHQLWYQGRYGEAAQIFEMLATVPDQAPRAHILLAHCKAMLGDYAGCSSTLSEGLPSDEYGRADSDLHESFVMWKCSFYSDVKSGLEKVIAEHPELPTPYLLLSELLMRSGNLRKPPELLRQAIERDYPDGAIASIARMKLPIALDRAAKQEAQLSSKPNRKGSRKPGA